MSVILYLFYFVQLCAVKLDDFLFLSTKMRKYFSKKIKSFDFQSQNLYVQLTKYIEDLLLYSVLRVIRLLFDT